MKPFKCDKSHSINNIKTGQALCLGIIFKKGWVNYFYKACTGTNLKALKQKQLK